MIPVAEVDCTSPRPVDVLRNPDSSWPVRRKFVAQVGQGKCRSIGRSLCPACHLAYCILCPLYCIYFALCKPIILYCSMSAYCSVLSRLYWMRN